MRTRSLRTCAVSLLLAMLMSMTMTAHAAPPAVQVTLDGASVAQAQGAYLDANGRTQVPAAMGQALGLETTQKDGQVTFSKGNLSITFQAGSSAAGGTQMDTAADCSDAAASVPLSYLARYFGYQVTWDSRSKTAQLTSPVPAGRAQVETIQPYTDLCFYGQKLTQVEIVYATGTDLSAVSPDGSGYALWDRGSAHPAFAQAQLVSATISPYESKVTLAITTDTEATTERTRNSIGAVTTGAWYIGADDRIYFGDGSDTAPDPITGAPYAANPNKKGYYCRETLDLILCHENEEMTAGLRMTDGVGNYTDRDGWLPAVDRGLDAFQTQYVDVDPFVTNSIGTAYDAVGFQAFDGKVPVTLALPKNYDPAKSYPLVLYVCGGGTSYWELYDEQGAVVANNPGTNLRFDTAMTTWAEEDVIIASPHVHSNSNTDAAHEVAAVVDALKQQYPVDQVIFVGNSNGTLILSETVRLYPTLGDVFFVVNGDFGKGGQKADAQTLSTWTEEEIRAVAEHGLAIWFHRGETDGHIKANQTTYTKLQEYYRAAGHSEQWIADNLRITAYMSWNFKYWGESDHSCTRLVWWNFANEPYRQVYQGQPALDAGDTYTLTGQETFDYAGADTFQYTLYPESLKDWALSR